MQTFETIEQLRQTLLIFRETYNAIWLIEPHGFIAPSAFRQKQLQPAALAAWPSTRCLNNRGRYMADNHQRLFSLFQIISRAIALHNAGLLQDAAELYQTVLKLDQSQPDALRLLGVLRAQQGELNDAARLISQSLVRDPVSAEAHNNLGRVLQESKRFEQAIQSYQRALSIRPRYTSALNNLGSALTALGRDDEAVKAYRKVLVIEPEHRHALNNLGASLYRLGRWEEALEPLQASLVLERDFTEAQINLAHVMSALGRLNEAIRYFELALKSQPHNVELHLSLADALHRADRSELAVHHYRKICAIKPDSSEAHAGLGILMQELGQISEAQRCFEQAIAINPDKPSYYINLCRVKRMTPEDPHFAAILSFTGKFGTLPERELIDAHFALGFALSSVGRHRESFDHFLAGNSLKRKMIVYNESKQLKKIESCENVFTRSFIAKGRTTVSSALPVFIVGMPRSGSTLLERILSSHSKVFSAGETAAFERALGPLWASFPEAVPGWTEAELVGIAEDYIRLLEQLATPNLGIERITDKMLDNFRYIGLINMTLPNARIIHMIRNPIDTCLSCFSIHFKEVSFSYDLGELGRYYRAYARLMRHWRKVLPADVMLEVQYRGSGLRF